MFSACSQIFKCPANWLLVRSVYAENEHGFSLKLISLCISMEESGERRDLHSERTNDHLVVWKQSLGLGQAHVRQKKKALCLHCMRLTQRSGISYYPVGVFVINGLLKTVFCRSCWTLLVGYLNYIT